jgi:anti-sigma-K factor RskA
MNRQMKTSPPNHEDHDRLSAALRRDAARVQEPPFDPALHQATLQRITAMPGSRDARAIWWRWPALAGAAALAVVTLCIGLWIARTPQNTAHHTTAPRQPDFTAVLASTQTAVTALSSGASSPLPVWMSPTASLLEPPTLPSINPKPHRGNKP